MSTTALHIWLLDVGKPGDTQQMRLLAEALPGSTIRVLRLEPQRSFPKLRRFPRHDISWLSPGSQAMLRPAWPDLVFLAGRLAVSVALWIKRRSPDTLLVAFGRPRAPFELFDLIISNPAFHPPDRDNVLILKAPLNMPPHMRVPAPDLEIIARQCAGLPRPRIALIAGGSSPPYAFSRGEAAQLGERAARWTRSLRGSLMATTSRRLGPDSARALFDAIKASGVPADLYDFNNDEQKGRHNPYAAYLALADAVVVTIDSLSMMTEAAACKAMTCIYPLRKKDHLLQRVVDGLNDIARSSACQPLARGLRALHAQGMLLRRADRELFAQSLIQHGHAVWFSDDLPVTQATVPLDLASELDKAKRRVLNLLKEQGTTAG